MISAMKTIADKTCIKFLDIQSWIGYLDISKKVVIRRGNQPMAHIGMQNRNTELDWQPGMVWGTYVS